jgi:hypothetical protein
MASSRPEFVCISSPCGLRGSSAWACWARDGRAGKVTRCSPKGAGLPTPRFPGYWRGGLRGFPDPRLLGSGCARRMRVTGSLHQPARLRQAGRPSESPSDSRPPSPVAVGQLFQVLILVKPEVPGTGRARSSRRGGFSISSAAARGMPGSSPGPSAHCRLTEHKQEGNGSAFGGPCTSPHEVAV